MHEHRGLVALAGTVTPEEEVVEYFVLQHIDVCAGLQVTHVHRVVVEHAVNSWALPACDTDPHPSRPPAGVVNGAFTISRSPGESPAMKRGFNSARRRSRARRLATSTASSCTTLLKEGLPAGGRVNTLRNRANSVLGALR